MPLRPQSTEVLRVLVDKAGEVVTKDALIAAVWRDVAVTDDSLTQCISDIRRALGDSGRSLLQTVPRKGYRLVIPQAQDAPEKSHPKPRRRRFIPAALAAVVVLCGALAAMGLRLSGPEQTVAGTVTIPADDRPSVRIMPFVSLGDDPRWQRIGLGMGAEIAAALSRDRTLHVIGAENHGLNVPDLPTRYRVDGTLLSANGTVRATASMVETDTSRILWSGAWVLPDSEVTHVIDTVTGKVLSGVGDRISGAISQAEAENARRRVPATLGALDLYMLGLQAKNSYFLDPDDPTPLREGVGYLTRAIEADPDFAAAHDVLGWVQNFLADVTPDLDAALALYEASNANVRKAARLDPGDALILAHLAMVRTFEGDFAGAWQDAQRAVALAPNTADVLAMAASAYPFNDLQAEGPSQAVAWSMRALDLNPAAPAWYHSALAFSAYYAGDMETALREARKCRMPFMAPVHAAAAAALGEAAEAEAVLDRFRRLASFPSLEDYYFVDAYAVPALVPLAEGLERTSWPVTRAQAEARLAQK
ncbi:winged helix-turn-helix domain-containing tetratricopeptide repeat protein [Tropicibacter sp. S64]|uniref:winged helix-turn-helix domain-containing tetratricopeptide repeat protein n=1 Tax=Tropicibacter sp. S64 TaxID=3415122 RepID=UPI003C7D64FB